MSLRLKERMRKREKVHGTKTKTIIKIEPQCETKCSTKKRKKKKRKKRTEEQRLAVVLETNEQEKKNIKKHFSHYGSKNIKFIFFNDEKIP